MKFSGKIISTIAAGLMFAWFGMLLAHKIDLATADLGRHILNGEVIMHGTWQQKWAVLHTNFYSFVSPNQPFINHHWLSGVAFYFLWLVGGFAGLSFVYVALGVMSLYLFWDVARRAGGFWLATISAAIILPLIASRVEVRPEMFTYLLTGVFFWMMWRWREGKLGRRWLFALPALMLVWVNLHIGFAFGFLVLGAFGLERLIKVTRNVIPLRGNLSPDLRDFFWLVIISVLCVVAGFINPNFVKGFFYPLFIFRNYGYLIVENQSILFLQRLGFGQTEHFLLFEIIAGSTALSFIAVAVKNWRRIDLALFIMVEVSGAMAFFGIRNFPSFALLAVPALAVNASIILPRPSHVAYRIILGTFGAAIVIIALVGQCQYFFEMRPIWGLGLQSGAELSANFLKANRISGPIFNDYDIGSFLEFELSDMRTSTPTIQQVFVDNRPEAYTTDFFQHVYIPAQENDADWQSLDAKYGFNAIVFSYRDYTPWAQAFLIKRVNDPAWAPVFVDDRNIILLKRGSQNQDLIKKYELPRSLFSVGRG